MGLKERIIARLLQKRRGEPGMAGYVGVVIGVFVTLTLATAIFPTAFNLIFHTDVSAWQPSTVALWYVIPLIGSLAVVLLLVGLALAAFKTR